ncbi:MAG: hypothetical protein IKS61_00180 [Aeriscardovia sp.]|nr:hypothetical protein [Aeriscardovia sp.]
MESQSNPSGEKPFSCLPGRGEEIVSFIGALYLPSLPGSFEARAEKSERSAEAFGSPGREAVRASSLLGGALARAGKVTGFFSEWDGLFPALSRAYAFSKLEGDVVVLEARSGLRAKRRRFDEAEIEKALNEHIGGARVRVKIV